MVSPEAGKILVSSSILVPFSCILYKYIFFATLSLSSPSKVIPPPSKLNSSGPKRVPFSGLSIIISGGSVSIGISWQSTSSSFKPLSIDEKHIVMLLFIPSGKISSASIFFLNPESVDPYDAVVLGTHSFSVSPD